jgi:ribosomal protein L20
MPLKKACFTHTKAASSASVNSERCGYNALTPALASTECPTVNSWASAQKKGIELNRKVLADLAMNHPAAFKAVVDQVK